MIQNNRKPFFSGFQKALHRILPRLLAFVVCLQPLSMKADKEVRLRLIETSDVHGNYLPYDFIAKHRGLGGLSRVATYVSAQRDSLGEQQVVLLDNGDILQGQPTAYYYNYIDTISPHFCAEALNYLHYDAATIGNHDIETGHRVYDRWVKQCRFPMLCANAIDQRTSSPYWRPYTIIERAGVRIAVLGMITTSIPQWLPRNLWAGIEFADMVETARVWMPVLRGEEGADVVVGLFHSGAGKADAKDSYQENAAYQVAHQVPGFDVIFYGHDHRAACKTVRDIEGGDVLVLNPGASAMNVAVADVAVTMRGKRTKAVNVEGKIVSIANLAPQAEYLNNFIAQFKAIKAFTETPICNFQTDLSTRDAYFGPSSFVDFIHTLQLQLSGADISFNAPLSYDTHIKAGPATAGDMFNLYKFENMLYLMALTGKEVKDYLEYSYGGWVRTMTKDTDTMLLFQPHPEKVTEPWQRLVTPSYNFDSAAGLRYSVNLSAPRGQRIVIKSMADGSPFCLDSLYTVAVNSYRGNGGGNLITEGAGINKAELPSRIIWSTEKDFRFYLMQALKKLKTVNPQPLNQWEFVPALWAEKARQREEKLLFE